MVLIHRSCSRTGAVSENWSYLPQLILISELPTCFHIKRARYFQHEWTNFVKILWFEKICRVISRPFFSIESMALEWATRFILLMDLLWFHFWITPPSSPQSSIISNGHVFSGRILFFAVSSHYYKISVHITIFISMKLTVNFLAGCAARAKMCIAAFCGDASAGDGWFGAQHPLCRAPRLPLARRYTCPQKIQLGSDRTLLV